MALSTMRRASVVALLAAIAATQSAGAQTAPVKVQGIAYDSLRGQPLSNALVMIIGAPGSRTTDERGRFEFDSVPPGVRTVIVQHAALDTVGLRGLTKRVALTRPREDIRLSIPSFQTLWKGVCGGNPPRDSGFVYGTIRDVTSRSPVANAEIELSWIVTTYEKDDGLEQQRVSGSTRSDSNGGYVICGVPAAHWLRIAAKGSTASGRVEVPPAELRVQRRDLFIGPTIEQDSASVGSIVGLLTDQDGAPFSEARIVLDDSTETRSRGDGRFFIRDARAGTRTVEVLSIGMVPIVMAVDVLPRDSVTITLALRRVTTLDVVRVTASRRGREIAIGIEERRKNGFGFTMTMTELQAHMTFMTVLNDFPSVIIRQQGADYDVFVPDGRGGECTPEIFVDGSRLVLASIRMLQPRDVMAVEVYPRAGSVPLEFRRSERLNSCGAILVWTHWAFSR